jgi:hypothetical protein
MPSQSRKHRGRQSEHIVADYLRERGWPFAEAVGAGRPGSDITGTPDLAVEVKARRNLNIAETLRQAEANAHGRLPFAVIRLDGQGPASIDDWPVVVRFGEFVRLLTEAGYGDGGKS